LARAVAARPIAPELLEWVERPLASEIGLRRGDAPRPTANLDAQPGSTSCALPVSARRRRIEIAAGQVRIALN